MKKLFLLQLGAGNVGGKLIEQITEHAPKQYVYCGVFTSKSGIFKKTGLSKSELKRVSTNSNMTVTDAIDAMPLPFVLIDTTASDKTMVYMKRALKRGGYVTMSNKKPIAGSQKDFDALHNVGGERLFYETSVGAGLPVISTLKTLLATGDDVLEIQGCFSGTLGFLFSQIENGASFSQAVLEAKKLGFTEPDPRDDLSGVDVARKALILARLLGMKLELADVKLEGLYPKSMEKLSIEAFLNHISDLDKSYKEKTAKAKTDGKVLRFVAKVTKKGCKVGLVAVDKTSDIGGLSGPDNLIVFKTKRYEKNQLIIKGPGAGGEVTAAGVFGDISTIFDKI